MGFDAKNAFLLHFIRIFIKFAKYILLQISKHSDMKNSRFLELFFILNHNDIKGFDELVNSVYFNKNERVKRMWDLMKEHYEDPQTVSKEMLTQAIFPGEKFNESNFRMVISAFVKLAEEYLLQKEYRVNSMERNIRLLEIFEQRGMRKSYSKYLREIENELDKEQKKDSVYYYRKYFVECLKAKNSGGDIKAARDFAKKAYTSLQNLRQEK